jgi:hypothetical protein
VLSIQPRGGHGCDEELGSVRVRPCVGHGYGVWPIVLQRLYYLVFELSPPNRLTSRAIAPGVSRLVEPSTIYKEHKHIKIQGCIMLCYFEMSTSLLITWIINPLITLWKITLS